MKKVLFLLLFGGILLVGCTDDSDNDGEVNSDDNNGSEEKENDTEKDREENEKKDVYQIGETAQIESDIYEFPYEVTVNSFELTTDEVDGKNLEDYGYGEEDDDRFAVVNVTIKNTSDRSFVPNEKISAQILKGQLSITSEDDIFTDRENELEPGEEITGNLVYIRGDFMKEDLLYLVYELQANEEETKFELPVE